MQEKAFNETKDAHPAEFSWYDTWSALINNDDLAIKAMAFRLSDLQNIVRSEAPENSGAMPERQGASDDVTLWALFFPTTPTLSAGQEIKVVWRMTGTGDFSISATGPDGTTVKPTWGPDPHDSSPWTRPR